jgi:hypothetical protein
MDFTFKLAQGRARRLAVLAIALDEGVIITPAIERQFRSRFKSDCAHHGVATTTTICIAAQENWITRGVDVILSAYVKARKGACKRKHTRKPPVAVRARARKAS